MGWGYCGKNEDTGDEMGYSVEGVCFQKGCGKPITHGLANVCGGMHEGDTYGCGRYFCEPHLVYAYVPHEERTVQLCEPCSEGMDEEEV